VCWQPEARRLTFWKRERRPGMEVAAVGRGLAPPPLASGRRSSSSRASLVTGSRPVSLMTLRMRRFSYRCPDFLDTTGSSGTVPEMEHSIVPLLSFCSALSSLMFGFHWFTGTERMRAFSCSRLSVGRW
jgi:hypothetical protein